MEQCPRRVRAAIRTIPSAYEVGFNVDKDEVYVSYDATATDAVQQMVTAIETRAGFKPSWKHADQWPELINELKPLPR